MKRVIFFIIFFLILALALHIQYIYKSLEELEEKSTEIEERLTETEKLITDYETENKKELEKIKKF